MNSESKKRKRKKSIDATPVNNFQTLRWYLVHASNCENSNCPSKKCAMIKKLLAHGEECKIRAMGGCPTCKLIWWYLNHHAGRCEIPHCTVVCCKKLKQYHKEKLLQKLVDACKEYIAGLADGSGIPESDLWKAISKSF